MIHKFNNPPSLSWIRARLNSCFGQRFEFVVNKECFWVQLLVADAKFNLSQPIHCNGIFTDVLKIPKDGRLGFCGPKDCEPVFYFRDCLFKQGGKECFLATTRRFNKRRSTAFSLKDVGSGTLLEICRGVDVKMITSSVGEERT